MYTQACTTASARPSLLRRLLGGLLDRLLGRLLDRLARHETEARARHRLARLEPHLLRDIGMTAEEAEALAKTPEWDAPAHWKR